MANEHYKQGSVETRTLISKVFSYLPWLSSDEAADVFNIVKYSQRAGLKDGVPWEKDAYKIADYITHMKYGKYIDQIDEENELLDKLINDMYEIRFESESAVVVFQDGSSVPLDVALGNAKAMKHG